jgi:hypothetical protein
VLDPPEVGESAWQIITAILLEALVGVIDAVSPVSTKEVLVVDTSVA